MADENTKIDDDAVQHTRVHDFRGGILKDGSEIQEGNDTYTDGDAQDAVGDILSADFTYNDSAPSIDLSFDPDQNAIDAVNGESSLDVDITGDAATLGGNTSNDYALLADAETVGGLWTFNTGLAVPSSNSIGLAGMDIRSGFAQGDGAGFRDTDLDTSIFWGYDKADSEMVFGRGSGINTVFDTDDVTLQSGSNLSVTTGNITIGGDDVVSSSAGDYDIQKDGTDGAGIINFKTS